MDLWYERSDSPGTRWSIRVSRPLYSAEGPSGRVEVLDTEDFGRVLAVGGILAMTEEAGFAQREMLAHAPLNAHRGARTALIVGGRDLGTAAEMLRYPELERLVLVEDDEAAIEAQRKFFPSLAQALSDPRLTLETEDAEAFVRDTKERFEIAVVQSPGRDASRGEMGFGQGFWCDCFRVLAGDGLLASPAGCAYYPARRRELLGAAGKLKRLFPIYRLCRVDSPDAEGGSRLIGFASKKYDPELGIDAARWAERGLKTRYYDAETHKAAFAIPKWIAEIMEGA